MNEIRLGALLSYVTILMVNLSGLLLTPFIIRTLGNEEYGLYLLIGSLAAYLGVLDFGLNNAVTRYVAQCAAKRDRQEEAGFLGAALVVNALASVAIIGLGAILYSNIDIIFSNTLDAGQVMQARAMLLLLITNIVLTISSGMFTAISTGHERFTFTKIVNLLRYLLRIGLVLAILAAGGGAVSLVALDAALALLMLIANAFYAIKKIGAQVKIRSLSLKLVLSVLTFSTWSFLYAVIGQVQWQGGQLIIGATLGTNAVAIYGVGIMFAGFYAAFSSVITNLFMPRANQMIAKCVSQEDYGTEMMRIGRISLLILFLILGGFFLYGSDFITLWAGPEYGTAWLVALIIMLAYTVPLIQTFAHQLLEAKGLMAFKAKVYLITLPLGVLLGYLLLEQFGVLGMAIGMASGWIVAIIVMNIYFQVALGISLQTFFFKVSKGIVPVFLVCLGIGSMFNFLPITGWSGLIVRVAAFASIYTVTMYFFGMNGSERFQITSTFKHFQKR